MGTLAVGALLACAPAAFAQSRAESVVRVEDQRTEAVRTGRDVARFYDSGYRGITGAGRYETIEQIQSLKPNPAYSQLNDMVVEVHDDTAIVTVIEGSSETETDLALRIWTRRSGTWTIAAAQTTWIGNRPNASPLSAPLSNTVDPFKPATAQEESIWRSQDALMRAFSNADAESYKAFSTEKSLRMTTSGDPIARDTWLTTIARRQKGPLAVVDEVAIEVYGSVAVVRLRGHEANPTRQSWVYLREGGVWKLHLRFTTAIRSA